LLYVAKYQLELGFGFIDDADALRRLRKQQLRSHLEAPWATERTIEHPALDEFSPPISPVTSAARKPGGCSG